MSPLRVVFLLILVSFALPAMCIAQDAPTAEPQKTVRVLAIGNSFTVNATQYLRDIVNADGRFKLDMGKAEIGGSSLEKHWQLVAENKADPKKGRPYSNKSLKDLLTEKEWDIVIIQQVSWLSPDAKSYQPYGKYLAKFIREHAPTAKIWIHETWAYRADDTMDPKGYMNKYKSEDPQGEMYKGLHAAYKKLAQDIKAEAIMPVGTAFQVARARPDWQFTWPDPNFDYDNPKQPNLPDQTHSLNAGYRWAKDKGKWTLKFDTHHASNQGKYLGGAVWFEMIFDASILGNTFVPDGVTAEECKILQEVAHEVVSDPTNTILPRHTDETEKAQEAAPTANN